MNTIKKIAVATSLIGLPFFAMWPAMAANTVAAPTPFHVVAYYPSWGIYRDEDVSIIPADSVTDIIYAFATIQDNKISLVDTYAALQKAYPGDAALPAGSLKGSFRQLQLLKQSHPGLKVLISVGGWTYSQNFSAMAASAATRQTFVQSVVTFLQTYGFDGVDIDWESPVLGGLQPGHPEDRANFTALLKDLRTAFGQTYELTAAIGARPETIKSLDFTTDSQYVDWFNLMAYDLHGPWDAARGKVNHQAALYDNGDANPQLNLNAAVKNMETAGVPAAKIVAGMPFYGRSYTGVSNGILSSFTGVGPGTYSTDPGLLDYKDIHDNYLNKNGYVYYWDDVAKEPYLLNKTTKTLITFDDARSVAAKTSYARDAGLSGVMFWTVAMDNGDLVKAIVAAKGTVANYSPSQALAQSPDINTDKGLAKKAGTLPCASGSRLKTSTSPAVYYCGADGKRYVFPNQKTYASWYADFRGVATITAKQMAAIPLGGNVTYRPGFKMVKIESDPKVYAVAPGGTLRWISTAQTAANLYGVDWNKKIDDISDAFFVNYKAGAAL